MSAAEEVRFDLLGGPDPIDTGPIDARPIDARPIDAGSIDARPIDAGSIDDERLRQLYRYPDNPQRCVVRANAIASLDGGATTGGTSGGLGSAGDRWLFTLQRELADVIVVGLGTARTETYGGAHLTHAERQRRRTRGQADTPPIALVTASGLIEPELRVLTDSEVQPLVLTSAAAQAAAARRVGSAAEVVDCSAGNPTAVHLPTLLGRLAERGLLRVLSEGGPSLLGSFISAGLLDEICLTTAPLLVGGDAVRIVAGGGSALSRMRRTHLLSDADGYLFTRHVRMG